ncbi:MAG: hypothetical protein LBJ15_02655 [Comamonas sp.]|uniref:S24 family peptidase n=1 Tax=Comamonas sp. TaxID=34028 RepID=UPI002837D799|nr:S24 family peptidase [Comamonas sp.]MDR0212889.1 hypothetical protein [Comamonas sp.]
MDKYEIRRQALQSLVDHLGRGGIAAIAQKIGKDASYVSRMLYPQDKKGSKRIGEDTLEALVTAYPGFLSSETVQRVDVLPSREEIPPSGYVRLQHLSPRPTMGHGAVLDEPVHVVRHLDVLERWLMEEVGSSNYARVKVLTAVGRSMMPTINDKDLVFVDVSHRAVDAPGIYVIDVAGRLLLKKAMIKANGTLVLRSDNAAEYPDEETYDLTTYADEITVCGKVLAWWALRKG